MAEHKEEKKPEKGGGGGSSSSLLAEILILLLVLLLLLPVVNALLGTEAFSWLGALTGQSNVSNGSSGPSFLDTLFARLKMVSTLVTMIAVAVAVYSFLSLHALMSEETKKLGVTLTWEMERTEKNARWERVQDYMRSLNSSDWKVAILEADNILDEVVERMGYKGETLGDRMKKIEPSDFPYLDDAWKAHKLRNAIAHKGGSDFILTRAQAEQTINVYERVFKELGYL